MPCLEHHHVDRLTPHEPAIHLLVGLRRVSLAVMRQDYRQCDRQPEPYSAGLAAP